MPCARRARYLQWLLYSTIFYTMLEYNAYLTIHWSYSAQAVIYVRNRPWGGGNTLVVVHRDWCTVSEVLCKASPSSRNTTPPPLFLSCNTTRLRVEGLSRIFFLPWPGLLHHHTSIDASICHNMHRLGHGWPYWERY